MRSHLVVLSTALAAQISEETVVVTNETDVLFVRAIARPMAASLGFDVERAAEIETAVSELAGNRWPMGRSTER